MQEMGACVTASEAASKHLCICFSGGGGASHRIAVCSTAESAANL